MAQVNIQVIPVTSSVHTGVDGVMNLPLTLFLQSVDLSVFFNNDHSISNQMNIKRKSWQNKRFPPKHFKAHRKFINNRKAANVTDLFKKTRHKCSICFQNGWHVSFLLLIVLKCTFYSFCSALISSKKKTYTWRCYGAENGNTSWNNVIMFVFNHVNLHLSFFNALWPKI